MPATRFEISAFEAFGRTVATFSRAVFWKSVPAAARKVTMPRSCAVGRKVDQFGAHSESWLAKIEAALTDCHCTDGIRNVLRRHQRLHNGETRDNIAPGASADEDCVTVHFSVRRVEIDGIWYDAISMGDTVAGGPHHLHISAEPMRTRALPMMYHGEM